MKKLFWSALSLALICATASGADDDKKKDEKQPDRGGRGARGGRGGDAGGLRGLLQPGGGGLLGRGGPLLSEKEMDELKLSSEQKDKVSKIVKDYDAKQKESSEAMRKAFEDLRGGGQPDLEKLRELGEKLRGSAGKAREEAEDKLKSVLNDDQKKKFDDLKKARPARGPGGGGGFPGGGFGGGRGGAFSPGQVLPGALKERLELSDEQKKKIEEIEKDVKAKLDKILTDEQKKKLEQGGGGGRRPGADGGRPGGRGGDGGRPGGGRGRPGGDGQPRRPRPDLD